MNFRLCLSVIFWALYFPAILYIRRLLIATNLLATAEFIAIFLFFIFAIYYVVLSLIAREEHILSFLNDGLDLGDNGELAHRSFILEILFFVLAIGGIVALSSVDTMTTSIHEREFLIAVFGGLSKVFAIIAMGAFGSFAYYLSEDTRKLRED